MDIGMKYFNASLNKIGVNNMVLKSISQKNTALIMNPAETNSPFSRSNGGEFYENMVKIAGSEEELSKAMSSFNEAVVKQEINYYKLLKN